jgi:hypothetical protein
MEILKIKEWFLNKTQVVAGSYNVYIDFKRDENLNQMLIEDGYATVFVEEKIAETEKAIQVRLSSGLVVGSSKGWKTWIPKSVIA